MQVAMVVETVMTVADRKRERINASGVNTITSSALDLQCGDIRNGANGERADTQEAWYWIARMAGLRPQQHCASQ
jgi:hypothetical protein